MIAEPAINNKSLPIPASVKTKDDAAPIRKTAATFNPNATAAFVAKTKTPKSLSWRKGAHPSVNGKIHALMTAQTGAKKYIEVNGLIFKLVKMS